MPNAAQTEAVAASANRIGCIVLSAGRSRRFGRTRINKLLAPIRGQPLICHVLNAVAGSGVKPVVIVTGHQRTGVERAIRHQRDRHWPTRFNRHHRQGMASSLQAGLRAMPASVEAVVVCLADMPGVTSCLIARLMAAYQSGDAAVIPVVDGRRGNPVLLGRPLFAAIAQLSGDQGARSLLRTGPGLRYLDTDADAVRDIDTKRDWNRAVRRRLRVH
ncbi:MAG: 4-diphosphocytidyl-2C-methyl-D-erythritol kinase [Hydrocarboniphaga sp.]|uniref:nucleotidyltransferase family protein n=1 Tax=Hydrocarboniphaga sp. TaxID=2033016 RepID=UPI00262E1C2E|nr:nucleotidyltransferase family protein [Hydrocarboniphaga sp.]MDB5968229.1 4-diphosphocytidyl-2C-methyl-D-erythritol kinase [Hydrocarboniphaga sp.]